MTKLEIREIRESHFPAWDKFVKESQQGNLFSTSLWRDVLNKYPDGKSRIIGIFSSNDLVSGFLIYERKKAFLKIMAYPPLTPFTTILFRESQTSRLSKIESSQKKIIKLVSDYLSREYNYAALQLEPSIKDVRPFLWLGWKLSVNYTYEIALSDINNLWKGMDKDAKYEINKAKNSGIIIEESKEIDKFLILYEKTFLRQNSKAPIKKGFIKDMFGTLKNKCRLYSAITKENETVSGALVVWDEKKAYYLMAASEPNLKHGANYLLLWRIIEDMSGKFNSIDLVGANIPNIIKFKREFATELVHYFVVEKYSPFFIEILDKLYRNII